MLRTDWVLSGLNRVGKYEDDIYYDLGDQHAVEVVSGSWQVVDAPPIVEMPYTECISDKTANGYLFPHKLHQE